MLISSFLFPLPPCLFPFLPYTNFWPPTCQVLMKTLEIQWGTRGIGFWTHEAYSVACIVRSTQNAGTIVQTLALYLKKKKKRLLMSPLLNLLLLRSLTLGQYWPGHICSAGRTCFHLIQILPFQLPWRFYYMSTTQGGDCLCYWG